tara:strand:- start:12056 stop:12538 length:483 start_codon:yes stop_codon:yes gene_type:complete
MNNQLLFFGLAVASVLVFLLVFRTFEPYTYTKAAAFASGNNFITLDANGDIQLQPVLDVDNAIEAAADSITADAADTYKTKASASSDRQYYDSTFQTKTDAAASYQPKGDYIVRNMPYKLSGWSGDWHPVGIGGQDNWGEKYVRFTGNPKSIKEGEFKFI